MQPLSQILPQNDPSPRQLVAGQLTLPQPAQDGLLAHTQQFGNVCGRQALSAGVDIGQGIGLGQSCGSLGSDSILYQPVQFADGSDTSWSSGLAGQYQYSALSPPYA